MKPLRIFVLVLLAMLLPLRGVSAAVVACEQQAPPHTQSERMPHGHGVHAAASQDHGGFDEVRPCVSSCSALPLMGALPSVAPPAAAGATVFPRFAAPAPTFLSGGQDRPPRSI